MAFPVGARPTNRVRLGLAVGGAVLILVLLIVGWSFLGAIKSSARSTLSLAQGLADHGRVQSYSRGRFDNLIFLHESVGRNLIEQGYLRGQLASMGYNLWDHDYNWLGLRDPAGKLAGYSYRVPRDRTDPDIMATVFRQRRFGLPLNTLSALLQHEVIIYKPCFLALLRLTSDQELAAYQQAYLQMRDSMAAHPDRVLILVTPPPLNPAEGDSGIGARARTLSNWLTSHEFLAGHPNVFTFDLFGLLAEDDPASPDYNMLRAAYRNGDDSHPNQAANQGIAPALASFIDRTLRGYRAAQAGMTTDDATAQPLLTSVRISDQALVASYHSNR